MKNFRRNVLHENKSPDETPPSVTLFSISIYLCICESEAKSAGKHPEYFSHLVNWMDDFAQYNCGINCLIYDTRHLS